ncbi:hypothetical protein PQX77_009149 [Marasmius sp. AFHP31]|nr:hypothetical protein PQX77_009149 [Marasmius sp. AFHP31]
MKAILHTLPLVSVLSPVLVLGYTWPSWTDELEDIMYLQSGMLRRGFHDGISPCSFSTSRSPFRQGSAEWLRTAFHDAITHDKSTGQGGLDASLMYEMERPENQGNTGLNATFGFFTGYQSIRSSMADLLALGVYTSVRECAGPVVPFRAGRIDATVAGETGVPEPTTDLQTTIAQFEKAGFSKSEMIAMVACGHTLGGVHGNDFPDITGDSNESSFPRFDSTTAKFDNTVVTEYFAGNTSNPLVVGPHATNSDLRVFTSDNNATMQNLRDPAAFRTTCASILQRMIDTVPSTVTLTEPIQPVDVKPMALKLSITSASTIRFEGFIRIRMTQRQDPPPQTITIPYKDRNGVQCGTCTITATMSRFQGGQGLGFDDHFQFYEFATDIPHTTGISSFTVQYSTEPLHTNGGNGFPIRSEILAQPLQSCVANLKKMKIVAAVQNDRVQMPVHAVVNVKNYTPGVFGAVIERRKVALVSTGTGVGEYTFFSGETEVSDRSVFTQYDLVSGGEGEDEECDGEEEVVEYDDGEDCDVDEGEEPLETGVVKVEFLSTALFAQSQDESGCPTLLTA